jgi:hypothetical protein
MPILSSAYKGPQCAKIQISADADEAGRQAPSPHVAMRPTSL